jgi:carbonic anhydrase/acetyltransferase-like protein (isoleucine patch superfamily)
MIRSYQGRLPQIPASCYVDLSAQVIGDVTLGEHSSVWMNAVLRGDVNSIRVGANSNVQDCAVLHGQRNLYPVIVGDWVTIGHNATVHGCVVEDAVLIGMGVTILNGCRIGEGSIIAAGAVVPEHTVVPPRTLWAGVPPSSAANSATKTAPSSSNTPRTTWTTRRFTSNTGGGFRSVNCRWCQ